MVLSASLGFPASRAGAAEPAGGGPILPRIGALFGAKVALDATHTDTQRWSAQDAFESQAGRMMDIDKQTYSFDERFPGAYEAWSRDLGRTLYFDWNPVKMNGGIARWPDIAAGKYDAIIDAVAQGLKAFAAPAFLQFGHEPELLVGTAGTAQDFVNAYRHVHDRLQADGVTNVSYIWTLMAYTYRIDQQDQFWPGSQYVDLIGADGYNWYGCPDRTDPWNSFAWIFGDYYTWAVAKGKSLAISEWASHEDASLPGRKAVWITDAAATIQAWPQVKVVAYFENGQPAAACDWWIDSSSSSQRSFSTVANTAYFETQTFPTAPRTTSYVPISDSGYGNSSGLPTLGGGVQWVNIGPGDHSVSDTSGMGLFDSGTLSAFETYTFVPVVAANYPYSDDLHPNLTGTLRIPILASPPSGNLATDFTVTWASRSPPAGYVVDVQIQRPGSPGWTSWLSGVTTTSSTFTPDGGRGTYLFRSRIRKSTGEASWYSESVTITVH